MPNTVLDLSKYSPEVISMLITRAYSRLPSLRPTILSAVQAGQSVVTMPYSTVTAAAHKADGVAITWSEAGTTGEITVTVDKRPFKPVMLGKLAKSTAIQMTPDRFFELLGESIAEYEIAQTLTTITGMTADTTLTVDLVSEGVTQLADISERIAAELGTASGSLSVARMMGPKYALIDPRVAGRFLSGSKFASQDFVAALGGVAVAGLRGAANWLDLGFIVHPSMAAYTTLDGTDTNTKILVYEPQVAGEIIASDIEFSGIMKDTGTGEEVAWAEAVMGFGAGRTSSLVEIDLTINGNPFNLSP